MNKIKLKIIYERLRQSLAKYVTQFKARYLEDPGFRRTTWIILGAFILSACAALRLSGPPPENSMEHAAGIDESIPDGFVLIPIKVQNEISLNGVFEDNGYVDLYSAPEDEKIKSQKILSGIKMLRSTRQRDQFSIIVKNSEAAAVIRARGSFFVAVQSRLHHRSLPASVKPHSRLVTIEKN